jgi:flagellar FliJ protein
MTYKFPLQRLLELREQREHAMARELATARDRADATRQQHDTLAAARANAHARVAEATSQAISVGHLVNMTYALSQLTERTDAAQQRVAAADAAVDERQGALTSAAQDRQILDRLRSRRLDEFRAAEAVHDRKTMDEIALARFTGTHRAPDRGESAGADEGSKEPTE